MPTVDVGGTTTSYTLNLKPLKVGINDIAFYTLDPG